MTEIKFAEDRGFGFWWDVLPGSISTSTMHAVSLITQTTGTNVCTAWDYVLICLGFAASQVGIFVVQVTQLTRVASYINVGGDEPTTTTKKKRKKRFAHELGAYKLLIDSHQTSNWTGTWFIRPWALSQVWLGFRNRRHHRSFINPF